MSQFAYDFRSDTVTAPSPAMRAKMAEAEVGDDVYGGDPTVARLEQMLAERLGLEAGMFVPSGTMSNLSALMSHCARGEEYIAGQEAHCYRFEAGGGAVLGSIQPQPIVNQPDGTLALADIEAAIKPHDMHFARTRLLALENTISGRVLSLDYQAQAIALARKNNLSTHLDGARLFNASVALGCQPSDLAKGFDTISICLSKGLGAPVGSVLVGNKYLIDKARWTRKMLGGGMRQSGILAAAGIYALENNVERLADDHANAARLAEGLAKFHELSVKPTPTNMVFVDVSADTLKDFAEHLSASKIGVSSDYQRRSQRWVTHLDAGADAVDAALEAVGAFFKGR